MKENGSAEFSLTPCGLVDTIQMRLGLIRDSSPRFKRRALVAAAVAWLPLLVVALVRPRDGEVAMTFFHDIAVHVRFLLVVPLLIMVERGIGLRTKMVANEFVASGLVVEGDVSRLQSTVNTTRKLLNSAWVEVAIAACTYLFVWMAMRSLTTDGTVVWFERAVPGGQRLTPAGWWYVFVASPLVGFLFLRWTWRYLVWSWFLRRVSRLDLRIAGSHPDRAGGLGFVNIGQTAFASVMFAASSVVAATAANRILYEGVSLTTYGPLMIGFVVASLVIGLAPFLAFIRPLLIAKWKGLVRYGRFSNRYVQSFEGKWLSQPAPDESMLGSGDIQSLADLGGSFERVDGMRTVPFDRRTVMVFAVAAAAPVLPLLLTVMPFKEIVKLLVKAML
jgi:hypothetical protein